MFVSKSSNEPIQSDQNILVKYVPVQLPKGVDIKEVYDQVKTTKNSMTALVIIQLVSQLFLKSKLEQLWNLFFTLQLICYLKTYSLDLPANADLFVIEF